MATNFGYDDEDDDFMEDVSGGDVVKQLRKVNRSLEKRLRELETEATSLKTAQRQRTVKDVLSAKGVNPKVATFIPSDIEPTEEAVTAWLGEYGDVFGVQAPAASNDAPAKADPALQAQSRINNVMAGGMPPTPDEDALSKILSAKSASELNDILGVSVY